LAFEWFSPILPDLTWGLEAALGTLVPVLGFMGVYAVSAGRTREGKARVKKENQGSPLAWSFGALVLFAMFWFSLGLLPVYPASVAGYSMVPTYDKGDMVIATAIEPSRVETGDVIVFIEGRVRVVHRVIEVETVGEDVQFRTQGDGNPAPDPGPVLASQLQGRVLFSLPRMGWATLWLRSS